MKQSANSHRLGEVSVARARVKADRRNTDIADAIIAEWYRILPDAPISQADLDLRSMDANSLTAAFNQIIEGNRCQAVLDEANKPLIIAVPRFPPEVTTRKQLLDYLAKNDDFRQGMGAAVLFGCGR